jgi:hypothetical protein
MLQLSAPLRVNWLASPATGLRDGPIEPQLVSTKSWAVPLPQPVPAVEIELQVREGAEVQLLHEPHDPAV